MAELLELELPTATFPDYSYTTSLDGKEYKFRYQYNVREVSWALSISLVDGTPLLYGCKLVPWIDLLLPYTREDLPLGTLILIPIASSYPYSPDITLENLSEQFFLSYLSVS